MLMGHVASFEWWVTWIKALLRLPRNYLYIYAAFFSCFHLLLLISFVRACPSPVRFLRSVVLVHPSTTLPSSYLFRILVSISVLYTSTFSLICNYCDRRVYRPIESQEFVRHL